MAKAIDITGMRSGLLTALYPEGNQRKKIFSNWVCKCDCGNYKTVRGDHIYRKETISCGCQHYVKKYNNFNKRLYNIWITMKQRCSNKNANHYNNYGGRGIGVCDEWANDYAAFHKWSMENGYSDGLTIDRIDNSLGYSPENCRWVTKVEQSNNRRNTRYVDFNGKSMPVSEVARKIGINPNVLLSRLNRGWEIEKAFSNKLYRVVKPR